MTFKTDSLVELLKSKVNFRPINTGWEVGKCQCCNDYKERAGFKFTASAFMYNCWNCNTVGGYDGNSTVISKKTRDILNAYGLSNDEINQALGGSFFANGGNTENISLESLKAEIIFQDVELPKGSLRLGFSDLHLDQQTALVAYLDSRNVDLEKYPMYFCPTPEYLNRVIIPYYRNGKLIYWQGRSILENDKNRYINAPVIRDSILFNIDKLNSFSKMPLFITEGVFDAVMVDGVALLGSTLNTQKQELLSKSNRRKIFLIDKNLNGKKLAYKALSLGWDIMFTPDNTEDLNDCVQQYGKIWTADYLVNNIPKDKTMATVQIELYCK